MSHLEQRVICVVGRHCIHKVCAGITSSLSDNNITMMRSDGNHQGNTIMWSTHLASQAISRKWPRLRRGGGAPVPRRHHRQGQSAKAKGGGPTSSARGCLPATDPSGTGLGRSRAAGVVASDPSKRKFGCFPPISPSKRTHKKETNTATNGSSVHQAVFAILTVPLTTVAEPL